MSDLPLNIKEPPRWAFWRFGYLAYRMIREHQQYCIETGEATKEELSGIKTQIHSVGGKIDEVLTTVRAFVEMQPELKTAVTRARDRTVIWHFLSLTGKIVGGVVAAGAAMLAIGLWAVPLVRTWIGAL